VSGHAYQEELKAMLSVLRPRYFVPIHGEFRHLVKHRQLAIEMGIENPLLVEDGNIIHFYPGLAVVEGRIETGRILVDGKGVGDVGGLVLRDRRHLSEDGLVIASLVIDKETKEILSGPDILSRGFIHEETQPEILDGAKCVILEVLDGLYAEDLELDSTELQAEIRKELKRFFNRVLDRRPVIYPIVVDI
jgi:ribonuclease J